MFAQDRLPPFKAHNGALVSFSNARASIKVPQCVESTPETNQMFTPGDDLSVWRLRFMEGIHPYPQLYESGEKERARVAAFVRTRRFTHKATHSFMHQVPVRRPLSLLTQSHPFRL